ncbi:hypothetical protein TMatcc_010055 [Talaromyces marneffei ATCC 18224]|nr:hypothetical protein EYB25_009998 [Talaromyces marneffei]
MVMSINERPWGGVTTNSRQALALSPLQGTCIIPRSDDLQQPGWTIQEQTSSPYVYSGTNELLSRLQGCMSTPVNMGDNDPRLRNPYQSHLFENRRLNRDSA